MRKTSSLQYKRDLNAAPLHNALSYASDASVEFSAHRDIEIQLDQQHIDEPHSRIHQSHASTLNESQGSEPKHDEIDAEVGNSMCMICWERSCDCILLECGHCGICVHCASRLWEQNRRCPLCRTAFAAVMRITSCDDFTVSYPSTPDVHYLTAIRGRTARAQREEIDTERARQAAVEPVHYLLRSPGPNGAEEVRDVGLAAVAAARLPSAAGAADTAAGIDHAEVPPPPRPPAVPPTASASLTVGAGQIVIINVPPPAGSTPTV